MKEYDYKKLDSLFHSRIRLAAASLLYHDGSADFNWLKDQTGASDGNLASHLRKLEEAGYIRVEKSFSGRKTRTVYYLTDSGQRAFEKYVGRLEDLLRLKQEKGRE